MTENTGIPTNRAPRDVASPFEPASSNAFGNASRWLLVIVVVGFRFVVR